MVGLAWMDGGARSLYTKKKVQTPADLKGMKVRMMGNPLFVDTMNAMGGNGISMGYGEVFSALQTGVIDGAENNPPSLFTSNHYTAGTKFYAQTNHLIIPEILVMSKVTGTNSARTQTRPLVKKLKRAKRSWSSAAVGQERGRLLRQAQSRWRGVCGGGSKTLL
jgi:TRAP-type C4-dicarboxylate transport system substrate-binding protein